MILLYSACARSGYFIRVFSKRKTVRVSLSSPGHKRAPVLRLGLHVSKMSVLNFDVAAEKLEYLPRCLSFSALYSSQRSGREISASSPEGTQDFNSTVV